MSIIQGLYCILTGVFSIIWETGKVLHNIACMGKIAALVLLKLFINGNEKCHQWHPLAHERNYICKYIQHMIPEHRNTYNYTMTYTTRLHCSSVLSEYSMIHKTLPGTCKTRKHILYNEHYPVFLRYNAS